jgi:hypothetical protein
MSAISYNYYANIPNAPDNPSFDQPLMQVNSQSINSIIAVDHVGFKSTGSGGPGTSGGQHLQVTFNGKNVPAGAPTDPLSIMYTNNITVGTSTNTTSASSVAEVFYQNSSAVFPISMIKAFGSFDKNGNSLNTWNCSSSGNSGGYTITLATGAVAGTGNNYCAIVTPNAFSTGGYSLVGTASNLTASSFLASFRTPATTGTSLESTPFSIIVLQL